MQASGGVTDKPFITVRVAWWMQAELFLVALLGIAGGIASLSRGMRGSPAWLLLMVPCAGVVYGGWKLARATIEVTDESMTVASLSGRFRIRWGEVTRIVAPRGPLIALMGDDKWLTISLQQAGPQRYELVAYLLAWADEHGIVVEDAPVPVGARNTKLH